MNKNKIAIMYSGLTQPFNEKIYDNHKRYLLEHYDCDIYLSTWRDVSNRNAIDTLQPIGIDTETYGDIEHVFLDMQKMVGSKYPETKPLNVFAMYYKIYKAFHMIENIGDYVLFVRIRLDILFDSFVDLLINNAVNIPQKGDHRGGILDLFGYGDYNSMQTYCNTFLNIPAYLKNGLVCHPETILRVNLESHNQNIKRTEQNIYLRNTLFTK